MVRASRVGTEDSLDTGVRSTMHLVASPDLDRVSGRYFDRLEMSRALGQAYDVDARRRLRELSERIVAEKE
jgi:hypothetical protein